MLTRCLLTTALAGLATSARAADLHVDLTGQNGPYDTIQSAIAVASDGDRVLVHPGTYIEALTVDNIELTIEGASGREVTAVYSPEAAVYGHHVVSIQNDAVVTLKGLTVDGSSGRRAVFVSSGAVAFLTDMRLQNGVNPDGYPGALLDLWNNATATVEKTQLAGGTALTLPQPWGGNIAVETGCSLTFGSEVSVGAGVARRGGGLWIANGGSADVWQADFVDNRAMGAGDNDGGGICAEPGANLVVRETGFTGNRAGLDGGSFGGAVYSAADLVRISGSSFANNDAYLGGAVAVETGSLVLSESSFADNVAEKGGSVGCYSAPLCAVLGTGVEGSTATYGGAIYAWDSTSAVVANTFCANTASDLAGGTDGSGGAVRQTDGSLLLRNNVFARNTALADGGAVAVLDTRYDAVNNHFLHNSAEGDGGAVYAVDSGGLAVSIQSVNDLYWGNDAALDGALSVVGAPLAGANFGWFWQSQPNHGSLGPSMTNYVDIGDPGLAGWAAADCDVASMQPGASSALIDAGDPTIADGDGSRSDIGAFGGRFADGALDDVDGDGVFAALDCDDLDLSVGMSLPWHPDADGDGFGDSSTTVDACVGPPGWIADGSDCDDGDPAVHPNSLWYRDNDLDGFGDSAPPVQQCVPEPGWADNPYDCNDEDDAIYPGRPELCDGVDQDCDGAIDEEAVDRVDVHLDQDGDGYGDPAVMDTCDPSAGVADGTDCDDLDASVHPGAEDPWYDGVDSDCDGRNDADQDGDGYEREQDCDDTDPKIRPGADDAYNDGVDSDCDGVDSQTWLAGGSSCACDGTGSGGGGWAASIALLLVWRRRRS